MLEVKKEEGEYEQEIGSGWHGWREEFTVG